MSHATSRMLPRTLGYLFDVPLALAPDSVAVIQGEIVLTYAQLDARLCRMANALRTLGVGGGAIGSP